MKLTNNHLTISPINQFSNLLINKLTNSPINLLHRARKYNKNMQNEPNLKNDQNDIIACNRGGYGNFPTFFHPQNEAKRTQNEPNFSPKLASFFNKIGFESVSAYGETPPFSGQIRGSRNKKRYLNKL